MKNHLNSGWGPELRKEWLPSNDVYNEDIKKDS